MNSCESSFPGRSGRPLSERAAQAAGLNGSLSRSRLEPGRASGSGPSHSRVANATAQASGRRPRLCLVGPMVGRTPGLVTTQGEILTDLFRAEGYSVISTSAMPSRYARFFDKIFALVRHRNDMDVIMIQTYTGLSFVIEDIASWIGRLLGKPILFHLRGGAMPEFMAQHPVWTQRVLRRGDLIVAPSTYLARAIEPYGLKAIVLPNIINISRYAFQPRRQLRPRLFWMRSFHPIYNPQMAIRVLAKVRTRHPDATLVMGGVNKGLLAEVEQLAESLGVREAVRFPGFLNMEQKIHEASQADIFISTNAIDNTPVAVIEACAMGLPVVSTDVGGMPYMLQDGENGLLVPHDDHGAMAEAIHRLLVDPELGARLSTQGRQLAESCSWTEVYPRWQEIIQDMVEHARRNGNGH